MSTVIKIFSPSPEHATDLTNAILAADSGMTIAENATNTVEVVIDGDVDAAIEILSLIVTAQPWFIGMNEPLNEALKKAAKTIRDRPAALDAQIEAQINGSYVAAYGWRQPRYDPLTLDLDCDGLGTVGINAGNPILFDHDDDGIKTGTGWVKSDDGFLVLDRNGNGTIDSGREMFGDATPLAGGGVAADGPT